MAPEEYQWYVKLVQDRYQFLKLTYLQAEKIYNYEQEKDGYSEKHFFSAWEEFDYELTTFREVLNNEQLKSYEISLNESIQRYEQSLIEQDREKTNDIAYTKELINFYQTEFLPDLLQDSFLHFGWLFTDQTKIHYIRTEYRRFLNETKKAMLISHFRHNRTFKPNELKASLLRHKLLCIFPDYASFRHEMDEPTKAVADYLKTKVLYLPDETQELLTRKFEQLRAFNGENFKKHYGDIQGWRVRVGHLTPEEEKEHRTMAFLLLDREEYRS